MLYVKENKKGNTVRTPLSADNTYTKCAECGREFKVNLIDLMKSGCGKPFTADMVCPKCAAKFFIFRSVTKEELQGFVSLFRKLGYEDEIGKLLSDYGIKSIAELDADDYADFANDVVTIVTEAAP